MALVAGKTLLQLAHFEQMSRIHETRELADQRDVLRDVPAELAELGVLLDEPTSHPSVNQAREQGEVTHRFISATVSILLALELADRFE